MLGQSAALDPSGALLVYVVFSVVAVAAILVISALVRERHADTRPDVPYESGVVPIGAGNRHNAPYFMIAVFFVIFDMEAAILFGWAVAARETGVPGLVEAAIFIGVLLAALAWLWADGALDFGPQPTLGDRRE